MWIDCQKENHSILELARSAREPTIYFTAVNSVGASVENGCPVI